MLTLLDGQVHLYVINTMKRANSIYILLNNYILQISILHSICIKRPNLRSMLGLVWCQLILDLFSNLELTNHDVCPQENYVRKFSQESEEVRVEGDPVADFAMEALAIVVGLVRVHVHTKTFRPNFLDPKSNDVRFVED